MEKTKLKKDNDNQTQQTTAPQQISDITGILAAMSVEDTKEVSEESVKLVKNTMPTTVERIEHCDLFPCLNQIWNDIAQEASQNGANTGVFDFIPRQIIWMLGCPGSGKTSISERIIKHINTCPDAYLNVSTLLKFHEKQEVQDETSTSGDKRCSGSSRVLKIYEQYYSLFKAILLHKNEEKYKNGLVIDSFCRRTQHAHVLSFLHDKLNSCHTRGPRGASGASSCCKFVFIHINVSLELSVHRQLTRGQQLMRKLKRNAENVEKTDAAAAAAGIAVVREENGKNEASEKSWKSWESEESDEKRQVTLLKESDLNKEWAAQRYMRQKDKLDELIYQMQSYRKFDFIKFNSVDGNQDIQRVFESVIRQIERQTRELEPKYANNNENFGYSQHSQHFQHFQHSQHSQHSQHFGHSARFGQFGRNNAPAPVPAHSNRNQYKQGSCRQDKQNIFESNQYKQHNQYKQETVRTPMANRFDQPQEQRQRCDPRERRERREQMEQMERRERIRFGQPKHCHGNERFASDTDLYGRRRDWNDDRYEQSNGGYGYGQAEQFRQPRQPRQCRQASGNTFMSNEYGNNGCNVGDGNTFFNDEYANRDHGNSFINNEYASNANNANDAGRVRNCNVNSKPKSRYSKY